MSSSKEKGQFIIVSGPSGVGKGTVLKALIDRYDHFYLSVSATTRAPREHEVHLKDYYFLTEEEFRKKMDNDEFIEWCEVHGNLYGTLKSEVEKHLQEGDNIFLEIDTQGAKKVKQYYSDLLSIFIAPPSFQDLFSRLKKRNTEHDDIIKSRLEIAGKELAEIGEYDVVIINEDIDQSVEDLYAFIKKHSQSIR